MPQPNEIKLGSAGDVQTLSMFGRKYSESYEDGLTREERSASGKLRVDVITRKKNFTLDYSTCDEVTVNRFISLFENQDDPMTLEVTHLTTTKTYTVWMRPFSRDRLLAVRNGLWEGVTVELSEI